MSLSPEEVAANGTISEKGDAGVYFKMEEDAVETQQTASVSQDKPCAKKDGKNPWTRKWFKWGSRQSRRKQLDDLTPGLTDDVEDDASCTSSLGSLWVKNDKKASKASRMQLDLSTKCKTSLDDNEGYVREEGPGFEENQQEEVLDSKTNHRQLVLIFLLHLGGVFLLSVWGSAVRC